MSTESKAFDAYQYNGCEDTLTYNGEVIKISRAVARQLIRQMSLREHEGHMFAAELKGDER